jgi:hypothetical protein
LEPSSERLSGAKGFFNPEAPSTPFSIYFINPNRMYINYYFAFDSVTTARKTGNKQILLLEQLEKKNRIIDLSMALLKLKVLPRGPVEITAQEDKLEKQVILVAPRGSVFLMADGRRIFTPNRLMEIEDYIKGGMRSVRTIQNDLLWALLIGLSGLVGLLVAWSMPRMKIWKDKAKIKRFIDERGDIVYVAQGPDGEMAHLLSVGSDRRYYRIHEPLSNAMFKTGHYIIRLTYPASVVSWKEVMGLEVDPKVEIMMDPSSDTA